MKLTRLGSYTKCLNHLPEQRERDTIWPLRFAKQPYRMVKSTLAGA